MKSFALAAALLVTFAAWLATAWSKPVDTILTLDTLQLQPGEFEQKGKQLAAGSVALVPGHFGRANQLSFVAGASGGFFSAQLSPTPDWDRAAGLSFWVKGDGSQSWGGLELVDETFAGRYAYCFPISSTEWRKITVPWSEFIPEIAKSHTLSPAGPVKPSSLRRLQFGKWYYWRDYPAATYAVDDISLASRIRTDRFDHAPVSPGTRRLLAKLEAKQPVTIVTVGDSLSDKHHWANREVLWSELLVKQLEEKYGARVTLIDPAIGGTELTQGLIVSPRWLQRTPAPDLIIIWFGYNDWSDGMRGKEFASRLRFAVDSFRRRTQGKADIMLMTTAPAVGRWTEMEELAQAARDVAREKQTGLADVAAAFHRAGDAEEAARKRLYCSDEVHLGAAGHALVADTVLRSISARVP